MGQISLSRILSYWAARQGGEIALVCDDDSINWETLERRSNQMAHAYADLGVQRDHLVTIALPNSIAFFVSAFATWKLGATPQPVSAHLPDKERQRILDVAKPSLLVGVDPGLHPGLASVPLGFEPAASVSDAPMPESTAASWKAMSSGGSTGLPKLIITREPAQNDPEAPALRYKADGCVVVPGPLYHNAPFIWAMLALFKGNRVCTMRKFNAEETLALVARQRADSLLLVPTMMQRIWALAPEARARFDLSALQTLWHTGAPCAPWLKQSFIDWLGGDAIWEIYGGTEGQGNTAISGAEWQTRRGSVGRPIATCEMKIVGSAGQTLGPGEIGEVYMRPTDGQASRYRYVGAEAHALDGGWESLGDLGHMDADGYLYLSDRLTDMIVSGGANLYPAEIEAVIDAFPGVRSSAVIGLPHADLGQAAHAIVDVPTGEIAEISLRQHLEAHLVRYKVPRSIEFVRTPLRDDAGKVRRKDLRAARLASLDRPYAQ
jgi:bile acid-coenzyme A ligase